MKSFKTRLFCGLAIMPAVMMLVAGCGGGGSDSGTGPGTQRAALLTAVKAGRIAQSAYRGS